MTLDFDFLREVTDIQAHRREMDAALAETKANHPAGKRLVDTFLDTSAEDAHHAEIVRLRAESDLAPVIELFGGRK